MRPDFWLERWRSSQIAFHQREINPALQAHWARLPADGTVFVPLCGKSRDMLWLRSQGHEVLGVELSRIAVRDFFAENGLTPAVAAQPRLERWRADGVTLLCGDFFDLTPDDLKGVTGVYDRAALIALPQEMRQRYVDKMGEVLPAGAETLLITLAYPEGEMKGPPFSVPETEVRRLYAGKADVTLLSRSDALAGDPGLRQRGLTSLVEHVFLLRGARVT